MGVEHEKLSLCVKAARYMAAHTRLQRTRHAFIKFMSLYDRFTTTLLLFHRIKLDFIWIRSTILISKDSAPLFHYRDVTHSPPHDMYIVLNHAKVIGTFD